MAIRRPLRESATVIADGAGNGTAVLRPDGPQELWFPTKVHVKASTDNAEAVCRVYSGQSATDQWFIDTTGSGSFGDGTGLIEGHTIGRHFEAQIFAVWTGADPGAALTATVVGEKSAG